MKLNIISKAVVAALLLVAGLQTTQAQGVRVHYKNGNVVDIPAALFDHMSPAYLKSTVEDDDPVDPKADVKVEPLDMSTAKFLSTLQQAGMPIHLGTSAPTVNGTFSLKPTKLVKYWSANPEDYNDIEVDETTEEVLKFTGQSGFNVWIDSYNIDENGPDHSVAEANQLGDSRGVKGVIVGSGSKFTAAYIITLDMPAYDLFVRMGYIISAEVSGNSLKDLYVAALSLDRDYNIQEYGIGCDGDGVSTDTTWAPLPCTNDSRSISRMPNRFARKKAQTVKEEYSYIIYKTDGTEMKVTQDELDYVETYEAAFDERITQEIPQEYLSKMSTYMPIYAGNTPPTLSGAYRVSPQALVYDAGGTYRPGTVFVDYIMNLSNQDKQKNTVDYESKEVNSSGNVITKSDKASMAVLGQGDNFTAFAILEGTARDVYYKQATIVSGTVTAEGVKDVYMGILMLDKGDDSAPGKRLMDVGTFRVFHDGDGMASTDSWAASRAFSRRQGGDANRSGLSCPDK